MSVSGRARVKREAKKWVIITHTIALRVTQQTYERIENWHSNYNVNGKAFILGGGKTETERHTKYLIKRMGGMKYVLG